MKKKKRKIILLFLCTLFFFLSPQSVRAEEPRLPEELTGMDLDGNVYVLEDENGIVEEQEAGLERSAGTLIVNFNTKGFSKVTNYTEAGTGTEGYTCGAYGADAAYLGSSGGKVKFMQSGVIGWVNSSDVQLVKMSSARSISYYAVSGGRLIHYISTNMNSSGYGSTLDQGPAPSYLSTGVKYYSYDGHYFYKDYDRMISDYQSNVRTGAMNPWNPYYNYFQYLPLRSQTAYSRSQLNSMINSQAGSSSVMYNLGGAFIDNQNTYGVNALIATGIAANESAWGRSSIAQTKNNLFGLNAVDSSPGQSANYYSSPSACVKEFVQYHMSKGYLYPKDWRYFGGFLGNKASGINVKYASDPYWGEKAANVAWMLDKKNGNYDGGKYTIGVKDPQSHQHSTLNVRNKASSSGSMVLYTTPGASSCSVLILGSENGYYRIQSDGALNSGRTSITRENGVYNFSSMYAYVSDDYIIKANSGSVGQVSSGIWKQQGGYWYYYINGVKQTGWVWVDGYYFYLGYDGSMRTGWQYINGYWYYFSSGGYMQIGWQKIGGYWFYFNDSGDMVTQWKKIDGYWYYFDNNGYMLTGWKYINGYWFYLTGSGAAATGWQTIDGEWYYFDENGYMLTGWQYIKGYWFYLEGSGRPLKGGWKVVDGSWYYFDNNGYMLTDWQYIKGYWFYLGSSGRPYTGWNKIDGSWYYFDNNGYMLTGWQYINGYWFYLTGSGAMATGWASVGNEWYYFDQNGYMLTGWQYIKGYWFYLESSGKASRDGWKVIDNEWYYFDENGYMLTGWHYINKSWFFLENSGRPATGWRKIDNEWYYFDHNGYMLTGWQCINEIWYYMTEKGTMAIGWEMIDGSWHYFNENGYMLTGWQHIDGYWYYLQNSGVPIVGWQKLAGYWHYFDASGHMQTDWQWINGEWYYFDKGGYMQTGWRWIGNDCYYFYSNGKMAYNTWIDGSYVDYSGRWVP